LLKAKTNFENYKKKKRKEKRIRFTVLAIVWAARILRNFK